MRSPLETKYLGKIIAQWKHSMRLVPKVSFSISEKNVERNVEWRGIARNVAYASAVTLKFHGRAVHSVASAVSDCTPCAVIMFLVMQNKIASTIHWQHSLDLAPSDYHLFGILKTSLGEQCFTTNAKVEKWTRRAFFANLDRSVYDAGICKLVQCYEKYLEWHRNYVKK